MALYAAVSAAGVAIEGETPQRQAHRGQQHGDAKQGDQIEPGKGQAADYRLLQA